MGKPQVREGFATQSNAVVIDERKGLPTTEFADGTGTDIRRPSWASEPTRAANIDVHAAFAEDHGWSDGPTIAYPDSLDVNGAFADADPKTSEMSRSQVDALLARARNTSSAPPIADVRDVDAYDDDELAEVTMPGSSRARLHSEMGVDDVIAQLTNQSAHTSTALPLAPPSSALPLAPPVESMANLRGDGPVHDVPRAVVAERTEPVVSVADPATPARRRGRVADYVAATFLAAAIAIGALIGVAVVALPPEVLKFDFAVCGGVTGLATLVIHLLVLRRPYWLPMTLATATAAGVTAAGLTVSGPVFHWIAAGLVVEALCLRMIASYQRRA